MKVIFKTKDGNISIDPNSITQFSPIDLFITEIEYEEEGELKTAIVFSSALEVAQCL